MSEYGNLDITITKSGSRYRVDLRLNNVQDYGPGYLEAEFAEWGTTVSYTKERGFSLFDRLFADQKLMDGWHKIREQHTQCRIRLHIDANAPELHIIYWELLQTQGRDGFLLHVAANTATPFSRYLASERDPGPPIRQYPLKILVAIANPDNLDIFGLKPINVNNEWEALRQATVDMFDLDLVQLKPPCTLLSIENELRKGYHILHFIGHGTFTHGQTVLYMANQDNKVDIIDDNQFAAMINGHLEGIDPESDDRLRMIFLASCKTATRSSSDNRLGLVPMLIRAGVPAVMAMQDLVTIPVAREFAAVFYKRLFIHGYLDLACNEARRTLLTSKQSNVAIPVLYSRLQNNLLFDIKAPTGIVDEHAAEPRIQERKFYDTLAKLNYHNSKDRFDDFLFFKPTQPSGAFVIHGEAGNGQLWLLSRLVKSVPNDSDLRVLKVKFGRLARRSSLSSIWHDIGGTVNPRGNLSGPLEIADQVYQQFGDMRVVLVLEGIENISRSYFNEFVQQFWQQLTMQYAQSKSQLITFFVDNENMTKEWQIELAREIDSTWSPMQLIDLPTDDRFTENDLKTWIREIRRDLPTELVGMINGDIRMFLLQCDDGVPERVLKELCNIFGYDWDLGRWQQQ